MVWHGFYLFSFLYFSDDVAVAGDYAADKDESIKSFKSCKEDCTKFMTLHLGQDVLPTHQPNQPPMQGVAV